MTFVATGDSFITRRLPTTTSQLFEQLVELINQGEVRFTNFEMTAHNFEGFPGAVSGGTWAIADPDVLKDIKAYGFNILAWANNHTLDYSYGGLEATEKNINKHNLIHAGVGKNLAEASAPKYLDCPSGRVALIAVTSTFHETWAAGDQRPDVDGRPGVNPLRFDTKYIITKDHMDVLKGIAKNTYINADYNLMVKEGFAVNSDNDNSFKFGKYNFEIGSNEHMVTIPLKKDVDRVLKAISEARRQADYVIVSVHSHEMKGEEKDQPADFLKEFSRTCIDNGAHAIIGHGPHILRGIEIYKERPIFYSLGNFIFQNDTVSKLPADFYDKYGLTFNDNIADALDERSDNEKKGLGVNPDVWVSVIPYWKMVDGKLQKLILYPIDLGYGQPRYKRGWPELSKNTNVLEKLKDLSKPFGTNIQIKEHVGIVNL